MAAKHVLKNIRILTHVREPLLDNFYGKVLRYMNHAYVDGYIAIERYDAAKMKSGNKTMEIVYNFVDFKEYNPEIKSAMFREQYKLGNNDVVFLSISRIAAYNGIKELALTANRIVKTHTNFHFFIAGFAKDTEDEYGASIRDLIREHESNIHLLEFSQAAPQLIASADVIVAPFTAPHFSRAIIEGAAMGVPSVASDIEGLDELVIHGKTGLRFDIHSETAFYDALEKIGVHGDLREELGRNAFKFAQERFDAVKNSRTTFAIYDKIIKEE
jgi:glycosyltransferase involved in cell wall biosynthesis